MCFFLATLFALAVCFGSMACWNTHPRPIFNALAGFSALALTVHGPVHRPFDVVQLSCPLSRKTTPKAQCFHLHVWRWGWYSWGHGLHSSSSKPRWVELMSKSWILVSSDHNTFTQNHWQFKALMISVLHGVVLPIVFLVTMVPAALRSLTRSSRVVLDWFLTVLMIIETPRCAILHGAPVQGRLIVILCFFHLRIIAQTVVTFSPNC